MVFGGRRRLSGTGYVALGTLRGGSLTGYDIKKRVDESTGAFYGASLGQIYPELRKLAEAHLVTSTPAPYLGLDRNFHRITDMGTEALRAWVATPSASPRVRDEAMLKLAFAGVVPHKQRLMLLESMGERAQVDLDRARRALARERERAALTGDHLAFLALQHQLDAERLRLRWAGWARAELSRARGAL